MNCKSVRALLPHVAPRLRHRDQGFTLVITLLLMMLLSLLAIGLLQLSSIALRSTSRDDALVAARSNARVALQMAIAQLQVTAGPDQRITGPAKLAAAKYPDGWHGVWTPGAIAGTALTLPIAPVTTDRKNYLVDARAKLTTWKSDWFLGPLVSPDALGAARVNLGRWSKTGRVEVPEVKVGAAGGLAWWTEDLSQQASLASGVNADEAATVGLSAAPRNDTSKIVGGTLPSDYFKSTDDRHKVTSVQGAYLAAQAKWNGVLGESGNERSYGLFTDPVRGGFKSDLTRFVESSAPQMGVLPGFGLVGINAKSSLLPGTNHTVTGPQWERLRNWFKLPGAASRKLVGADPDIARQTLGNSQEGWSLDAIRSNRLPLHPMVVDVGFHWDFTPATAAATSIRVHLFPRLTLWNPYNAELSSKRLLIVMQRNIDTGGGLMVELESASGIITEQDVIAGWGEQFRTANQASDNYLMFTVEPTTFGPGECLVFTPKTPSGGMALYDAANPAANVLTASQPVETENFYIVKTPNAALPAAIVAGARVNRYMCGVTQRKSLNWRPMPFFLKAAPDGAISATAALNSQSYPTLQRLYLNDCGAGGGYQTPNQSAGSSYLYLVPGWNDSAVNGGSSWGVFDTSRSLPRNWKYRSHLSWVDDFDELASVPVGVNGIQPPYAAAIMTEWNPLASVVCRTPSTYLKEHFDLHMGCWYLTKAANDANGQSNNWGVFLKGKARGCPFGDPRNYASLLSFPLIDIPEPGLPLQSIGSLRNVQLSPWNWHPVKPIGNSRPSPHSDKNATAIPAIALQSNPWDSMITQNSRPQFFNDVVQSADANGESLLYDLSFEANNALWDATFASSWALTSTWDGVERLPNRQYVTHPVVRDPSRAITLARQSPDTFGLWLPAYLLASEGAFNVNSISPSAWATVLGGLKNLVRTDASGKPIAGKHPFAKFRQPASGDREWGGGLGLSDGQIVTLSQKIVEVVKERGPFLGVSDFVNRRLANDASGDRGALDEALLRANLANPTLSSVQAQPSSSDTRVSTANRCRYSSVPSRLMEGAAGYIEQADLLEPMGGSLFARGDTFRIRASGASYDANGKLLRRVTCEAIIVRSPEYVVSSSFDQSGGASTGNSALVPPTVAAGLQRIPNPALHPINKKFGRRFEVLGLKWLTNINEL
jgi:hypothetical protein